MPIDFNASNPKKRNGVILKSILECLSADILPQRGLLVGGKYAVKFTQSVSLFNTFTKAKEKKK